MDLFASALSAALICFRYRVRCCVCIVCVPVWTPLAPSFALSLISERQTDNRPVWVEGALPGEEADVRILRKNNDVRAWEGVAAEVRGLLC